MPRYAIVLTMLLSVVGCSQSEIGEGKAKQSPVAVEQQDPPPDAQQLSAIPDEFLGSWIEYADDMLIKEMTVREDEFVSSVRSAEDSSSSTVSFRIKDVHRAGDEVVVVAVDEGGEEHSETWVLESEERFAITRPEGLLADYQRGSWKPDSVAKEKMRVDETLRQKVDAESLHGVALASYLARRGQHGDALTLIEKIFTEESAERCVGVTVGILESRSAGQDELDRIGRLLEKAHSAHPEAVRITLILARYHSVRRQFESAEKFYREALAVIPEHMVAMNNLAMLLIGRQKHLPDARRYLDNALQIAGRIPELLDSCALLEIAEGRPQVALALLEEAILMLPAAELYFHRAAAEHRLGRLREAKLSSDNANQFGLPLQRLTDFERSIHRELEDAFNQP